MNYQRVIRSVRRSVAQVVSVASSAAIVAGAIALSVAVRPMAAQQPSAVRVPAAALQRYVGEYVYPDGATFVVALRGDTLFQDLPGRQNPYLALSDTLFMLGPVFTAEFVIDQAGGVTQILSDGAGVEYRLRRKGSPPERPAAPPPSVRVPRSVLQRYVGVYEYIPGQMSRTDLRAVVALRGDTLTRWIGGKEQVLVPVSATRFTVAGTSLVTEFVVDEVGVTQVMGSGFQQMLARLTSKR